MNEDIVPVPTLTHLLTHLLTSLTHLTQTTIIKYIIILIFTLFCYLITGETFEAKKDLERLAEVRRKREEAAKKREAEGRAPGWSADGIASSDSDSDSSGSNSLTYCYDHTLIHSLNNSFR